MARFRRVQTAGLHYISNRSVELRNAFIIREDYQTFLAYFCRFAKSHNFTIHSYVLLAHGYYLLIETHEENLSEVMKMLNRQYAHYFNLKYGRNGSLWEGRYKSSFMEEREYAYYFMAFMENLPVATGISSELRSYPYSSYRQLVGLDECLACMENSFIFKRFNSFEEIKKFFNTTYSKEFIDNVIEILRHKNEPKVVECKECKECEEPEWSEELEILEQYFHPKQSLEEERQSVVEAFNDGISQKNIGRFLGVSQQAVAKRIKKYRAREKKVKQKEKV